MPWEDPTHLLSPPGSSPRLLRLHQFLGPRNNSMKPKLWVRSRVSAWNKDWTNLIFQTGTKLSSHKIKPDYIIDATTPPGVILQTRILALHLLHPIAQHGEFSYLIHQCLLGKVRGHIQKHWLGETWKQQMYCRSNVPSEGLYPKPFTSISKLLLLFESSPPPCWPTPHWPVTRSGVTSPSGSLVKATRICW